MTGPARRLLVVGGPALLAAFGLVHVRCAVGTVTDTPYLGALFALDAVAAFALAAALRLRPDRDELWLAGALLAALTFLLFTASRTVGLPHFQTDRLTPLGLLSVVLETGLVLLALGQLVAAPVARRGA